VAREEYELYLQAVVGLLGGELASEELQEAATQVRLLLLLLMLLVVVVVVLL